MGPKSFETFEKQAPGPTARVSRSKVSANQRQLPSKRIAFDTCKPMISANLTGSRRGKVRGDRNRLNEQYFQR